MATIVSSTVENGGSSPSYNVSAVLSTASRTKYDENSTKVVFKYTITAWLGSSQSYLGSGNTLVVTFGNIKEATGTIKPNSITVKSSSTSWSGTTKHTVSGTFYKIISNTEGSAPVKTVKPNMSVTASWTSNASASAQELELPGYNVIDIIYKSNTIQSQPDIHSSSTILLDCVFENKDYVFDYWIKDLEATEPTPYYPGYPIDLGESTTETFYAHWKPVYVRPTISNFNAYRENGYGKVVLTIPQSSGAHWSVKSVAGDPDELNAFSYIGENWSAQTKATISPDEQYSFTITITIKPDTDTGASEDTFSITTFISPSGVAVDINKTGDAVAIGEVAPDWGEGEDAKKGLYIAEDNDIYLKKYGIGSLADTLKEMLTWKELGTATGTTAISFNASDYKEIMVLARCKTSATATTERLVSFIIPTQELTETVAEYWGGGTSSISFGVNVKLSNTSAQLNWVYNNGSALTISWQTLKVFGRKIAI